MDRNTNGSGLVRDSPRNCLPNPPRGVGGKLVSAPILELIYRLHQADVAFLDQVQKLQTAVAIFLRNRNHQPEIGFDQLVLCLFRIHLSADDCSLCPLQFRERHPGAAFERFHLGTMLALQATIVLLEFLAARARNLLFQITELALQRTHQVGGLIHPFRQPLAFRRGQAQLADNKRNPHYLAAQLAPASAVSPRLLICCQSHHLLRQAEGCLVLLVDVIDAAGKFLNTGLQNFLGDLFLIEHDRVFN